MRRAWILPALALACSAPNPGFLVAEDGGEPVTTGSPGTGTTTATAADTDAMTATFDPTGEPLPLCPAWEEPALDLQFTVDGDPLVPPAGCPPAMYRSNGTLTA